MTYEYMCTDCGHGWEAEQSISEAPLRTCPNCKHDTAKRQVSGGAGFILKGGGWYADLYSSSGAKKPAEGATASAETKSGENKSADSKPKTDSSSTTSSSTTPASTTKGSSSTGAASS